MFFSLGVHLRRFLAVSSGALTRPATRKLDKASVTPAGSELDVRKAMSYPKPYFGERSELDKGRLAHVPALPHCTHCGWCPTLKGTMLNELEAAGMGVVRNAAEG